MVLNKRHNKVFTNTNSKTPIKLIAFDQGWVLFRPINWEILNKISLTNDEKYWLVREALWRTRDWIKIQLKRKKTPKQIISIMKKYYPEHAELLDKIRPILKDIISIDFTDNIKLGQKLLNMGFLVEIWSDNGLGGKQKNKNFPTSDAGLTPELPAKSPLYKEYVSVHQELKVPSVYSRNINILKEKPKFFKTVMARHKKIQPEEVIFIEDRPQNIKSALSLGINCIQFIPKYCERENVENTPIAHTTKELIKELKKKGVII